MNVDALVLLGKNAALWARTYTALVEALVMEGVPVKQARKEARSAATIASLWESEDQEGDE